MIELRVMPNEYGVASAPLFPLGLLSGPWVAPVAGYSGPEGASMIQVQSATQTIPRPMGTTGSPDQSSSRPPTSTRFLLFEHLSGSIPKEQAEVIGRAVKEACEEEDHEA